MNLFKRGFYAVTRKPIKSMILASILYGLASFLVIAVVIYRQHEVVQNEIRNQVGAGFRLELSQEDAISREVEYGDIYGVELELGGGPGFMFLTPRGFHTLFWGDIEKISQVAGISTFNVTAGELELFLIDLESVTTGGIIIDGNEISVRGVRNLQLLDEVAHEFMTLQEGRWIGADDVDLTKNSFVISADFADLNGIGVGDDIQLEWRDMTPNIILDAMERKRFEVIPLSGTVVGIFNVERPILGMQERYALENTFFSNLDFTERAVVKRSQQGEVHALYDYTLATFQIENVDQFDEIRAEILSLDINWERYNLVDSDTTLQRLSADFSGLEQIGVTLFTATMGSGLIILILVFTFLIRSRTHEIAILLSLGIKKVNILLQLFFEALAIFLVASLLFVISSPVILKFISGSWLNNALEAETLLMDGMVISGAGGLEASISEYFSEVAVTQFSITFETILSVLGAMIFLIIISIVLTSIPIMKMQPKDILSKMS